MKISVFLALLFLVNPARADYIFYKTDEFEKISHLSDDEYSRVFYEVNQYQFPMTSDPSFIQCLGVGKSEEECLRIKLNELNPSIEGLQFQYVPSTLMQVEAIILFDNDDKLNQTMAGFAAMSKIRPHIPLSEDPTQNNEFFAASDFSKELQLLYKRIEHAQNSQGGLKEFSDTDVDTFFLRLNKKTIKLSKMLNDQMVDHHLVNRESFKSRFKKNCYDFSGIAYKKFEVEYTQRPFGRDFCLILDEAVTLEMEAYRRGEFPIFRGGKVDSSSLLGGENKFASVSYGSTLLGGWYLNFGDCAFSFMLRNEGKKIVFVNKYDYLTGGVSRKLFKIPPQNTIANLLSGGEFFHARTLVPSSVKAQEIYGIMGFDEHPQYLYNRSTDAQELEREFQNYQIVHGMNLYLATASQIRQRISELTSVHGGNDPEVKRLKELFATSSGYEIEYQIKKVLGNQKLSCEEKEQTIKRDILKEDLDPVFLEEADYLHHTIAHCDCTHYLAPRAIQEGVDKARRDRDNRTPFEFAQRCQSKSQILDFFRVIPARAAESSEARIIKKILKNDFGLDFLSDLDSLNDHILRYGNRELIDLVMQMMWKYTENQNGSSNGKAKDAGDANPYNEPSDLRVRRAYHVSFADADYPLIPKSMVVNDNEHSLHALGRANAIYTRVSESSMAVKFGNHAAKQMGSTWRREIYGRQVAIGEPLINVFGEEINFTFSDAINACLDLNPREKRSQVERVLQKREAELVEIRRSSMDESAKRVALSEIHHQNPIEGCYLMSAEEWEVVGADMGYDSRSSRYIPQILPKMDRRRFWSSSAYRRASASPTDAYRFHGRFGNVIESYKEMNGSVRCACAASSW